MHGYRRATDSETDAVFDTSNLSENSGFAGTESTRSNDAQAPTPVPIRQVSVIAFAGLSAPIFVNFTYPFINEMIGKWSDGPEQLALRSGVFFGCYYFAEFSCVYFWGTLSDRIGRKPVILICLACGLTSTALLGVSTSFPQALAFRMMTGASYGDLPVLRSAMGDITDNTNEARAFSLVPLSAAIGNVLALTIGGMLIHPDLRFPRLFGNAPFFKAHPYALSCFAASAVSLLAFTVILLYFQESLKKRDNNGQYFALPSDESARASDPLSDSSVHDRPSVLTIISDPIVRIVIASYCCLAFSVAGDSVIFPLWLSLRIEDGGLGLNPTQIATILIISSILQTLNVLFLFPSMHRRVGTVVIYRYVMSLYVVFVFCYPIVHLIAQFTVQGAGVLSDFEADAQSGVPFPVMAGIGTMLVIRAFANIAWACDIILLTASAPTPRSLGQVNSIAQMATGAAKALGPPVFASAFSLSLHKSMLSLTWMIMGLATSISFLVSLKVREGRHEWRTRQPRSR